MKPPPPLVPISIGELETGAATALSATLATVMRVKKACIAAVVMLIGYRKKFFLYFKQIGKNSVNDRRLCWKE